jgi:sortase (surface protein transpeptidase)
MSLYEKIAKIIENNNIDELYNELKALLSTENNKKDKKVFFKQQALQAIEVYRDDDCVIIELYLTSISIWIKIYKDDSTSIYIYPTQRCECG